MSSAGNPQPAFLHPNFEVRWENERLYSAQPGERERILNEIRVELVRKDWFWEIVRKDWLSVKSRKKRGKISQVVLTQVFLSSQFDTRLIPHAFYRTGLHKSPMDRCKHVQVLMKGVNGKHLFKSHWVEPTNRNGRM